jgi:integrase
MATRYDRDRQQWVTEFEQTGIRVYRRHPRGIGKPQAEAWEVKRRREIYDRVDLDRKPDLTIGDAIDLWLQDNRRKNQKQALSEAKQWHDYRGRLLKDAPEVAAEAVHGWTRLRAVPANSTTGGAESRSATPSKIARSSTINRRLMLLKAVCKAMWRQKHIPENLSGRIQTLREPKGKEVFLTVPQVMALAKWCPSVAARSAIMLLAYSGLRASELLALSQKELQRDTLLVAESKTGRPRQVPIAGAARPYLSAVPISLSYWELRKQFLVARKKAGLPREVTLHTLRHTYASWLLEKDVDLYTVSKLLGHSSIYTTQRYAHLAQKQLKKAVARLG